jgi:hypothetical protein
MKRLITILAIILSLSVKAQDAKIDSTLAVELIQMADGIIEFDTINYRPILIADSAQNYYTTMNEYAIQFDRAMILMWNKEGERVRLWLRKTELPEIELKGADKKTKLPYKVNK